MLEGIDVSAYQGTVHWDAVRKAGKRFAFIKATEGLGYQDPQFARNWWESHQNGLIRGAYHFFHPTLDVKEQVDYFHQFVRGNGHFMHGDFAILDVEVMDGLGAADVEEAVVEWVMHARRSIDKNVIIYTGPYFWQTLMGDPEAPYLGRFPLWLADWGPSVPTLKTWPKGLSFWQYTAFGHCPGIDGYVDLSRFYGTESALRRIAMPPPQ